MGIFDRKKTKNLLLEDKELLCQCKSALAAINSKIENDSVAFYKKVMYVIDEIEYSAPSKDLDVYETDKRIFAAIDDLKIAVRRKVEKTNLEYCEKILNNIKQLLSLRNENNKRFKKQR